MADPFPAWVEALEARHTRDLTFAEVRRALQALSSLYVRRRGTRPSGDALGTAGKRAAFAMFYGPLHLLTVRAIVRAIGAARPAPREVLDLGCGTGVAGAAWAMEAGSRVVGVDQNGWAVAEARWTLARLGLGGDARRGDVLRAPLPGRGGAIVSAFVVNELADDARDALRERLLDAGRRGARVLIVEPIARGIAPWWPEWAEAFRKAGGRADEWRFPADLPPRLALLDRAAALHHRELTARSLWLPTS